MGELYGMQIMSQYSHLKKKKQRQLRVRLGELWTAAGRHQNRRQERRIWKTLEEGLSFLKFDLSPAVKSSTMVPLKSVRSPLELIAPGCPAFPADLHTEQTHLGEFSEHSVESSVSKFKQKKIQSSLCGRLCV